MLNFLRREGIDPGIIGEVQAFRNKYPTAEELVATAKAAHAKHLFDDLVRRLRATAKVAYPHGKDLFTRRMSTTPSKKDTTPSKKKENP